MRLIEPETLDVVRERDLRVPMDDGAVLLADRWVARPERDRPQPTVLIRSPYGRRQVVGLLFGRLLAERGLQVVIQSVRGTFGSEGEFAPFDERADGLATLRWIRAQPWHRDRIGMFGPSYLGLVQWAVAAEAGDDLAALAIQVSASQFYEPDVRGRQPVAGERRLLAGARRRRRSAGSRLLAINRGAARAAAQLLASCRSVTSTSARPGAAVPWFREAFANPGRDDAYWAARDFSAASPRCAAPVQFVGGWYDIFLPWMLDDFAALRRPGREPQLHDRPLDPHRAGARRRRACVTGSRGSAPTCSTTTGSSATRPVRVFVTGERLGWRVARSEQLAAARDPRAATVARRRRRAASRAPDRDAGDAGDRTATTPRSRPRRSAVRCCSRAAGASTTASSRRAPTC